jgi:hypothetical protein
MIEKPGDQGADDASDHSRHDGHGEPGPPAFRGVFPGSHCGAPLDDRFAVILPGRRKIELGCDGNR